MEVKTFHEHEWNFRTEAPIGEISWILGTPVEQKKKFCLLCLLCQHTFLQDQRALRAKIHSLQIMFLLLTASVWVDCFHSVQCGRGWSLDFHTASISIQLFFFNNSIYIFESTRAQPLFKWKPVCLSTALMSLHGSVSFSKEEYVFSVGTEDSFINIFCFGFHLSPCNVNIF